ncbi:MAG: hypothetical protein P4L51_01350 [Puia sp.]|nr:hypothetical protein [Puia sp.]
MQKLIKLNRMETTNKPSTEVADEGKNAGEGKKRGSKFPGIPDENLIKVTIGTIKEGALKRKPAEFVIPARKP